MGDLIFLAVLVLGPLFAIMLGTVVKVIMTPPKPHNTHKQTYSSMPSDRKPEKHQDATTTYNDITELSIKKMLEERERTINCYIEQIPDSSIERIDLNYRETILKIDEGFLVYFAVRTKSKNFESQKELIESGKVFELNEVEGYHMIIEELTRNDVFDFYIQNFREELRYKLKQDGFALIFLPATGPQTHNNVGEFRSEVSPLAEEYPELRLKERSGDLWETVSFKSASEMRFHKDIEPFVFIEPRSNYIYLSAREQDVIYLDLNVAAHYSPELVEPLSYYPSYSSMSIHQRAHYLRFLNDPFTDAHDIGYVFCLYYALERHLYEGDITGAFGLIMRFKDLYDNKSFQTYSNTALALSCLKKKKYDLIDKMIDHIRGSEKPYLSIDIYAMLLVAADQPFTAIDLFRYRADFGYKKIKYTKNNPEEFVYTIEDGLQQTIGSTQILSEDLRAFMEQSEKQTKRVYANTGLSDVKAAVPQIRQNEIFYEACSRSLNATHDIMDERAKSSRSKSSK